MKDIFKITRIVAKMPKTLRPLPYAIMKFLSGNNMEKPSEPHIDRKQIDAMIVIISREYTNAIAFLEREKGKVI